MDPDQIAHALRDILENVAPDADVSKVPPNVRLREALDLDSMDFLDIVMEFRERFGVDVKEPDYPRLATLESAVAYLASRLGDRPQAG